MYYACLFRPPYQKKKVFRGLGICERMYSTCVRFRGYTDKKENQIFLKYKEIQNGEVAKSYMRKGFLIHEELRKYLTIYEEAVSHI
jgi:hypothetical protein